MDVWYSIAFALGMVLTSVGTWQAVLRYSKLAGALAKAKDQARYFENRCDKETSWRKKAEDAEHKAQRERDEYRIIARTRDQGYTDWKWEEPKLIGKFTFSDNGEDNIAAMATEFVEFGGGRLLEVKCKFKVSEKTSNDHPWLEHWTKAPAKDKLWAKQLTCTLRGPADRIVREIGEIVGSPDFGIPKWKSTLMAFDLEVFCLDVPVHVVQILKETPAAAVQAPALAPEPLTLEQEIIKAHQEAEAEVDSIVTVEART